MNYCNVITSCTGLAKREREFPWCFGVITRSAPSAPTTAYNPGGWNIYLGARGNSTGGIGAPGSKRRRNPSMALKIDVTRRILLTEIKYYSFRWFSRFPFSTNSAVTAIKPKWNVRYFAVLVSKITNDDRRDWIGETKLLELCAERTVGKCPSSFPLFAWNEKPDVRGTKKENEIQDDAFNRPQRAPSGPQRPGTLALPP